MMYEDHELADLEQIYDALDRGAPEQALALIRSAQQRGDEDPVVRFLGGVALLELDLAGQAVTELRKAVQDDPDDIEFAAYLALALYRCCRFADAAAVLDNGGQPGEISPDRCQVEGLLYERTGDFAAAEEKFAQAAAVDVERFPLPVRVERGTFNAHVEAARARLPESFRQHLDQVTVIVDDLPTDDLLTAENPPLDPELLGLFAGLPLGEDSHLSPGGELPPRIYLFKRNLERFSVHGDELIQQIAITLYHELGHYLGMDEEELAAVDFD